MLNMCLREAMVEYVVCRFIYGGLFFVALNKDDYDLLADLIRDLSCINLAFSTLTNLIISLWDLFMADS